MHNDNTLLQQARQLIQMGLILAAPLSAMATPDTEMPEPPPPVSTAQLQADFSAAGTYSNSGFFTGELDEAKAQASTLGMGFKLSGQSQFDDSQLYKRYYSGCYDGACDPYSLYYSRGDTTGQAFIWGGKVTGNLIDGDQLKAAYEFTIDWTHTPRPDAGPYDQAWVSWALTLGFSNMAYAEQPVEPQWLKGNARSSSSTSDSLYDTGATTFTGELSAQHYAYDWEEQDIYWFVLLEAHLNEPGPRWTWPGDAAPANINGDFLRVTVPQNSIDVGVNAVPVPEAEGYVMGLAGLGVLGLLLRGRRRSV